MKSMKKRIVTTALAGAMAMSLAVPAFAASNTSTKVTASYSEIEIDVVVPAAATVQINPMEMPVKLPLEDKDAAAVEVASQLVTFPAAIVNNSSMDLTVGATVTGTIKGNLKFAAIGWDSSDETKIPTTNSAFVYLEMTKATADVLNDDKNNVDNDKLAAEWAKWNSKDVAKDLASESDVASAVAGTDGKNDAIVVVSAKAASTGTEGLVKLDAAKANSDGDMEAQVGSVGFFRLDGQVAPSPKTPWAKSDGFGATIAFTFKASKPTGK